MKKFHDITIYTSGSQFDNFAKDYFRQAGFDFEEKNIVRHPTAFDHMKSISGQSNTPVIVLDGRVIIGFHPELIDIAFKNDAEGGALSG